MVTYSKKILWQEKLFKALANQTRLRMLRLLRDAGEATITELRAVGGVSTTCVIKHLTTLSAVRLVDQVPDSYHPRRYRLRSRLSLLAQRQIESI